jgi:FkbM family methyltransferase
MSLNYYEFKKNNQSPWIVDILNKYLQYKTDGFLVEIGVGHTIYGIDKTLPENLENFERCGSNTADLLDLGWSGIYIEPIKEYCDEVTISHKNNLERLKIVNIGASNVEDELEIFLGDSFVPNSFGTLGYNWVGRKVKLDKTSHILEQNNCPKNIDLMSIDVEGFEINVIQGLDFTLHQPSIIIVEIDKVPIETINEKLFPFYTLVKNDNINGVWIKKELI